MKTIKGKLLLLSWRHAHYNNNIPICSDSAPFRLLFVTEDDIKNLPCFQVWSPSSNYVFLFPLHSTHWEKKTDFLVSLMPFRIVR